MLHQQLRPWASVTTTKPWLRGWNAPAATGCLNENKRMNLNLESKQLTHPQRKPRTFAEEGRNTDISGNRLDNRRKRRQPAPCPGTRWWGEGTRAPAGESSPWAAPPPPPPAAWDFLSQLHLPCSRGAGRHRRREAAGGPRSSAAAQDPLKLWVEKRERNHSHISDWSGALRKGAAFTPGCGAPRGG